MPMPAYVYLVEVIDQADFSRVIDRQVCKSRAAAEHWGYETAQAKATAAYAAGEEIISFDYQLRAIAYLDN